MGGYGKGVGETVVSPSGKTGQSPLETVRCLRSGIGHDEPPQLPFVIRNSTLTDFDIVCILDSIIVNCSKRYA